MEDYIKTLDYIIMAATCEHIRGIKRIVDVYAQRELMLHRSESELNRHLGEYFVAVRSTMQGSEKKPTAEVLGCMGLGFAHQGLSEIKSVAVDPDYISHGIGAELLRHCEAEAQKKGYKTLFALTYIPTYFTRKGWRIITKEQLPHKIWTDCMQCPKYYNCTEIAVCKELTEDVL